MTANVNVTKVLFKRGNTTQNAAYTGINGEITVDTQAKTLRIHDGVTTGGNIVTAGAMASYIPTDPTITSIQANVAAANAAISAITGIDTSLLANAATQQTQINLLNANVTAANALIPNLIAISSNIIPAANVTYSLGSEQFQWRDLWVSNNTIYIGNTPIRVDGGTLLVNGAPVSSGYSNANVASYLPAYTGNIAANIVSPTVPTIGGTASAGEAGITYLSGDLSKWAIFTEGAFTVGVWTDVQPGWTVTDNNGFTDIIAGRGSFGAASFQTTVNNWPSPASGKTYVFTSPDYQLGYTNPVEITVGSNDWRFGNTGTLTAPGNISTTGNITADYFVGNGSQLTGVASTGNIAFTDTTMSPPNGEDLIISAANSQVDIQALDFRVETTDDVRVTGNGTVSLRNLSATEPISIFTDYDGSAYGWEFNADGSLTTPGDITVAGDITGSTSASTLNVKAQPDSNTYIQLNNIVDSAIRTVANLEISTANTDHTWTFGTDGDLAAPGNISATGNVLAQYLIIDGGLISTGASPAPIISGFRSISTTGAQGNITASGNLIAGTNIIVSGNIIGNTAGYTVGYRDVPQVEFTGNATLAASDAGKHYYSTLATANVLTIPNNASVSWNTGTAITVVNRGTGNISVVPGGDVSLYLAGNSTSAARTITTYGMATLLNVAANVWMINGTGVV